MSTFESSLVSVDWLAKNLNHNDLVLLNATIPKVASKENNYIDYQILNARFFDIKKDFSDTEAQFPNTIPDEDKFNSSAQNLGINNSSVIVVYDDYGIYSSARAWWLFKAFGHSNVAVLDGGLPGWMLKKHPVEKKTKYTGPLGNFKGKYNSDFFIFFNSILSIQNSSKHLILDARANNRFKGEVEEPRKGLRSGHIPNSVNLPYQKLLTEGKMKSQDELKTIFNSLNKNDNEMVFSCGSGITACILALGAELAGYKSISVYDGSWTEYGTLTNE